MIVLRPFLSLHLAAGGSQAQFHMLTSKDDYLKIRKEGSYYGSETTPVVEQQERLKR